MLYKIDKICFIARNTHKSYNDTDKNYLCIDLMYSTEMGNGNLAKNRKYVCLAYFSSRSRRRGGYRGGRGTFAPPDRFREGHSPPLRFRIFCSYFQNSFSIMLKEKKPKCKAGKISVLVNFNV